MAYEGDNIIAFASWGVFQTSPSVITLNKNSIYNISDDFTGTLRFNYTGTDIDFATITIQNNNYIIKTMNRGTKLIWDYGGEQQYIFQSNIENAGEMITRFVGNQKFTVTWLSSGSHLFEITIYAEGGVTKDNFIVVYRMGDSDSQEFAEYYATIHGMEFDIDTSDPSSVLYEIDPSSPSLWEVNGQLVGISCSNVELLLDETTFNDEVLTILRDVLLNSVVLASRNILGIVLGYNVPGGFFNGNNIISSTSRIARGCARTYHDFDQKLSNKFYQRSIFKRFDEEDAVFSLIVSRIDAPSLAKAKEFVDNANKINRTNRIKGIFYIDPYSDRWGSDANVYTQDLLDFQSNVLPSLELESWSTIFMDPYIDVVIPFVKDDSFIWSWFTDTANSSFFQTSKSPRVFFYNADYNGAYTLRDDNSNKWPYLSLNVGYAATAGSLSNPTIPGFLDPSSFFKALLNGATIGEAYLFSSPYLDWTTTLIGDPLVEITFDSTSSYLIEEDEKVINIDESWYLLSKDLSRAAAYLYGKEVELEIIMNSIVDSNDKDVELDLLSLIYELYLLYNEQNRHTYLSRSVSAFFEYPTIYYKYWGLSQKFPTIDDYLTEKEYKVSALLKENYGGDEISSSNILDEGWWEFEHILREEVLVSVNYHFILEVYESDVYLPSICDVPADHINLVLSLNSAETRNWLYEKEKDTFYQIPFSGVPSSYVGRKIRYQSREDTLLSYSEYLTRGKEYCFRVRQYNALTGEIYQVHEYNDIIYT